MDIFYVLYVLLNRKQNLTKILTWRDIYMYSIYRQQVSSLHNTHSLGHKILSQEEKITKKISFLDEEVQTEYESFSYQIHLFFLQSSHWFKSCPKCANEKLIMLEKINLLLWTQQKKLMIVWPREKIDLHIEVFFETQTSFICGFSNDDWSFTSLCHANIFILFASF